MLLVEGRRSMYGDQKMLEAVGAYRRGHRVHFRRDMPLEERARLRYAMLNPEWQTALSPAQYVELERRVNAMRKRANRKQVPWDENRAWRQAFTEVLSRESGAVGTTSSQVAPEHRRP